MRTCYRSELWRTVATALQLHWEVPGGMAGVIARCWRFRQRHVQGCVQRRGMCTAITYLHNTLRPWAYTINFHTHSMNGGTGARGWGAVPVLKGLPGGLLIGGASDGGGDGGIADLKRGVGVLAGVRAREVTPLRHRNVIRQRPVRLRAELVPLRAQLRPLPPLSNVICRKD